MIYVYVVEVGEKYEGNNVVGVYATKTAAYKAAMGLDTLLGGKWEGPLNGNRWTSGNEYVTITEFDVEE